MSNTLKLMASFGAGLVLLSLAGCGNNQGDTVTPVDPKSNPDLMQQQKRYQNQKKSTR